MGKHGNRPILLISGGNFQTESEILDYTISNSWEQIGSLPSTYDDSFWGARALPSLMEDGAILQYHKYFYKLSCTTSECTWEIMEQELTTSVRRSVMMCLPAGYTC